MQSKVVAILETRVGAHLGDLIARRGGIPLLAPALNEVPDLEPQSVLHLLAAWRGNPYDVVIFQTGVGTRALFQAVDTLGAAAEFMRLLAQSTIVVRGPKPLGELNSRAVRIDLKAPSPFTTDDVLELLADRKLTGVRVLVQRYGATNDRLREGLEARGALVAEIATYRWALPDDLGPLLGLLEALDESRVDAVVFTSAVQIQNLCTVAAGVGRQAPLIDRLNERVIASIGPVCTRALVAHGVRPTFEASPPKLGPLINGLEAALISN